MEKEIKELKNTVEFLQKQKEDLIEILKNISKDNSNKIVEPQRIYWNNASGGTIPLNTNLPN